VQFVRGAGQVFGARDRLKYLEWIQGWNSARHGLVNSSGSADWRRKYFLLCLRAGSELMGRLR
jgi:hypothetical protein